MSDFLTTLAARTLGQATTVRPRPVHIFEAAQGGEMFNVPEPPRSGSRPAAPVDVPMSEAERSSTPRSAESTPARRAYTAEVTQPPSVQPLDDDRQADERPSVEVPGNVNAHRAQPREAIRVFELQETDTREEVRSQDHLHDRSEPPPPPRSTPARAEKPPSTVPRARIAPRSATEPELPNPSVRVTIGRVEVRALITGGQLPRAVPPKRTAGQSLEEYLKQRNGGRA